MTEVENGNFSKPDKGDIIKRFNAVTEVCFSESYFTFLQHNNLFSFDYKELPRLIRFLSTNNRIKKDYQLNKDWTGVKFIEKKIVSDVLKKYFPKKIYPINKIFEELNLE